MRSCIMQYVSGSPYTMNQDGKNPQDKWTDKQRFQNFNPLDKALLDKIKIDYHGGKRNGNMIFIFTPKDCIKGMHVLSDP